MYVYQEETN